MKVNITVFDFLFDTTKIKSLLECSSCKFTCQDINNGVDEKSVKMGLTFAFGSISTEQNVSTASLTESIVEFKLLESKSKQQQAKIQNLEKKLNNLREELKIARNEITSN